VLRALDLSGSTLWKDRRAVRILKIRASAVDYHFTGNALRGDGDGCADHCRKAQTLSQLRQKEM